MVYVDVGEKAGCREDGGGGGGESIAFVSRIEEIDPLVVGRPFSPPAPAPEGVEAIPPSPRVDAPPNPNEPEGWVEERPDILPPVVGRAPYPDRLPPVPGR